MRAALLLRLLETRRRGGLGLLAAGMAALVAVAWLGTDTPEGSYGLASDLAAALAYLGAILFGAYPIATDRERKRSFVPSASPVAPWQWALGNAAGAALATGAAALLLFGAAGLGTTLRGGIETRDILPIGIGTGYATIPLKGGKGPLPIRQIPPEAREVRLVTHARLIAEDTVGTPDSAVLEIDGRPYPVFWRSHLMAPVRGNTMELWNTTSDFAVALDLRAFRVLAGPRPFLANALGAALAPALGAAALAAVGAAAGALVSAPVAALLTTLLLLLASMKGFLHEVFAHEESLARAQAQSSHVGHDHGHHHGPDLDLPGRPAAKFIVETILSALPDLAELDRTDRVALGEWTGTRRGGAGAATCAAALALAALLGGLGVRYRRTS